MNYLDKNGLTYLWSKVKNELSQGGGADYEEGTWTPATPSGYANTMDSYENCLYKRVGNIVYFQGFIKVGGNVSMIGIRGLPYTPSTKGIGHYATYGQYQPQPIVYYIGNSFTGMKPVWRSGASPSNPAQLIINQSLTGTAKAIVVQGYYFI